jgi:hypothetical protein
VPPPTTFKILVCPAHPWVTTIHLRKISVTWYFLARMQLHAGRFRLIKGEKTNEFVLQCWIFNFLTVFDITWRLRFIWSR